MQEDRSDITSATHHVGQPGRFTIWWCAIRPATLWAGAAPVFVGAGLAAQRGINWTAHTLFVLATALVGALLIQVGCNLINDYADFERGTDNDDRIGPARAAAQGWLTAQDLKRAALLSLGGAALLGGYLTWVGGWPILILGILSIICAYAYTTGPFPLAYLGLGDVFVLLFFGLGAVGGTTWLLTADLGWHDYLTGLAVGALATAILVVNNLRDREGDADNNKRTLAVRFGARFARLEYTFAVGGAFLAVSFLAWDMKSWGWATPLIIAPLAVQRIRQVWRADGADLNPLLGQTAQLELLFCLTLTGGLFLNTYLGGG